MLEISARRLLPAAVAAWALAACECERNTLGGIPDAGTPPEPDAGMMMPPPAFPLGVGDKIEYRLNLVTWCNESFGSCMEESNTWRSEFRLVAPGPMLDSNSNSWMIPAEYFWQISERRQNDMMLYNGLNKLWLTSFGPWTQATGASANPPENKTYRTTEAFVKTGMPDHYPFFDINRFQTAATAFDAYVKTLDPQANVETQEAARKMSAGFLEPGDMTLLHTVEVIYHRLGFVCQVTESIGPWDPARPKSESGFRNNQRDFQSNVNAPRLTRVGGMAQFCKCGTGAGTDCE